MEPRQYKVSTVQREDLPRVLEVWEASVRATHHFLTEADIMAYKPLVRDVLAQWEGMFSVRDADGLVVAFAGVAGDKLEMLFVDPAWRGKGVGRRLVEYAVSTYGVTRVDVNEQNEQAVGFYLRLGFEVESRSPLDGLGKPFPLLHLRLPSR